MTKKTHRRRDGLLAPRRPKAAKPLAQRYGHVLDSTLSDIMPISRPAPVDEPKKRPEHLLLRSELFENLNALIDAAMARAGALNSDDDQPELAMCEAAGLSHAEYETIILRADGLDLQEIAKRQHVKLPVVWAAAESAMLKLDRFVKAGDFW